MFTKDKPFLFIDGKYIRVSPFKVKPPKDIEFSEDFPNCCEFHSLIQEELQMFIDKFPNSQGEKEVVKYLGLGKEDLKYILEKVPKQVKYVEQHIENKKNNDDWYEDITDYIEYNLDSLGSPSFGQGTMIYALKHWIKNSTIELEQYKRDKLLVFFEPYLDPKKKIESADLNILHGIHQKWIKSFPFELSYFEGLKPVLEKRMPFLSEKPRENRYSKIAKAKMHTESSFVIALTELTKSLLAKIDSVKLMEDGKISSVDQKRLELIKEDRKIKSKLLLEQYNKQERKYLKTIKKWLEDEKIFFSEIKEFDQKLITKPKSSNSNSITQNIPKRFEQIQNIIYKYLSIRIFIPKYETQDKGWKFKWGSYLNETKDDFPEGIAREKFYELIEVIKSNFPALEDQHQLLKVFNDALNSFDKEKEKSLIRSISTRNERSLDTMKEQRELSIILQIRDVYQSEYKKVLYEVSGQKNKDEKENEFINSWFDQSVTLEHWEKFKNLDLWFFLNQLDPTEEEVEEIEDHQYYLFQHKIKKTLDFLLGKYSTRETNKRIEILQSHIDSIENFFDKGFDSDGNLEKLKSIYRGIAVEKKDLMNAYSKVIIQEFDYQEDFLLSVKDTFKAHPVFLATLFYRYKKEAQDLVKDLSRTSRKPVKKTPRFSVKTPHKTEWLKDLITQLNFKIELVEDDSDVKRMYEILTAQDYNEIKGTVRLRCKTTQFVYIMLKLKSKFSNLTFAEIERSEKFYSSDGNIIKADNMSNSKTESPKDKTEIDAVFVDFMK